MTTFIYLNLHVLMLQWANISQSDGIVTQACEEMCRFFESSSAKLVKKCQQAILLGLCFRVQCVKIQTWCETRHFQHTGSVLNRLCLYGHTERELLNRMVKSGDCPTTVNTFSLTLDHPN